MVPSSFNISNAYPNPFNPSTAINIDIPVAGLLSVNIYNLTGQLVETVVNENVVPGSHSFVWDASGLTSGLYVISVNYNGKAYNQKVTLVK